jgi:hypothetical protein
MQIDDEYIGLIGQLVEVILTLEVEVKYMLIELLLVQRETILDFDLSMKPMM